MYVRASGLDQSPLKSTQVLRARQWVLVTQMFWLGMTIFLGIFPWVTCTPPVRKRLYTENLFCMLLARKHGIAPGSLAAARSWTEG